MKVTVLLGGPSSERDVSLVSGRSVADGLRRAGHEVFASDIGPDDLSGLDRPVDVVFPVLHGAFGESGELQEILESRGLAFVGSDSTASRLGMDKAATKAAWRAAGLPTPAWRVVETRDAADVPAPPGSVVVKPVDGGSSIDVTICRAVPESDARAAVAGAVAAVVGRYGRALVEQYVEGPEITVGLLEGRALAPIRIVPRGAEFFDYDAKYRSTATEHRFDTGLPGAVNEACRDLARRAAEVVGARDLARIDLMLDASHRPYLLEINTMPGFTPRSLLPEAAAHAGIEFVALVDRLVHAAHARHLASRRAAG